ncbi:MAG: phage major capsid protein [Burkholderiales bacterium]|nr:phage major capsid protein [Burkholderiales bacterium]
MYSNSSNEAFERSGRVTYGMAAREVLAAGGLHAFRGTGRLLGMEDREVAYRAGMWCRAVVHGDGRAAQWCRGSGVQLQTAAEAAHGQRAMVEGNFSTAGWLVPVEMETAIINNREQYGVARRIANVMPMSSASTVIPRHTGDAEAYFVSEGPPGGTESDPTGDQIQLVLKDVMTITPFGKSTAQDTVIALAELVAQEQARAFATKEDACLLLGDGTSTYGGMVGLLTLLNDPLYAGSRVQAASTHDTFPEVDISDVTSLIGQLPVYARGGARWLCSGVFDAAVFGRLKLNAGGNDIQSVQGQIVEGFYAGFPISLAHHMPAGAGTPYNGTTILMLGNFSRGVAMGVGQGIIMTVDPYSLAHRHLTRIITVERIDINCHGVLKSTTLAGPIVGLHGRT